MYEYEYVHVHVGVCAPTPCVCDGGARECAVDGATAQRAAVGRERDRGDHKHVWLGRHQQRESGAKDRNDAIGRRNDDERFVWTVYECRMIKESNDDVCPL